MTGSKAELPDISKFNAKSNISQGVVSFASGPAFAQWGFKEGKTVIMDINTIFK